MQLQSFLDIHTSSETEGHVSLDLQHIEPGYYRVTSNVRVNADYDALAPGSVGVSVDLGGVALFSESLSPGDAWVNKNLFKPFQLIQLNTYPVQLVLNAQPADGFTINASVDVYLNLEKIPTTL